MEKFNFYKHLARKNTKSLASWINRSLLKILSLRLNILRIMISHYIPVIYEDEHLLILNKPCELICHPVGHYQGDSVISRVRAVFGEKIRLTHRLDQNTSGILILAKSDLAVESIGQQFEKRHITKHYLAITHGKMDLTSGCINAPIQNNLSPNSIIKIKMEISPHGCPATTKYCCLQYQNEYSLLYIRPYTGRKHQIRLHLASLGHPVVGETLYASAGLPFLWEYYLKYSFPWGSSIHGHCLHAYQICFTHPVSKSTMRIAALPPASWKKYFGTIENILENIDSTII